MPPLTVATLAGMPAVLTPTGYLAKTTRRGPAAPVKSFEIAPAEQARVWSYIEQIVGAERQRDMRKIAAWKAEGKF